MGIINFSIPKNLVLEITKTIHFDNFVETGTYRGETSIWAAKHFEKVYTIEIDEAISKKTASKIDIPKNIEFIVGNSKDVLANVTAILEGNSFFWLDGHWCYGAGGKEEECPLLKELEVISVLKNPVIFIDDARCFLGPLPPPHNYEDWPTIDDIVLRLKAYYPTSFVTIIDDVIICVPEKLKSTIYDYWMKTFESRYSLPSVKDRLKSIGKREVLKYLLGL